MVLGQAGTNVRNIRDSRTKEKVRCSRLSCFGLRGCWRTAGTKTKTKNNYRCCSRFSEPCPRTQGFVCLKNWYYASRPSWKKSIWLNPRDENNHPQLKCCWARSELSGKCCCRHSRARANILRHPRRKRTSARTMGADESQITGIQNDACSSTCSRHGLSMQP